jgi:hypothetical protein
MARSNTEAEYRATTSTASKLVWIKQLLMDIRIKIQTPMKKISTTKLQDILLLISSFMKERNILRWIATSFEEKCNQKKLRLYM